MSQELKKLNPAEKSFIDEPMVSDFTDPSIQHDRVLIVEGQKFYVNSGILSFSSEFFNTLFNGPYTEKNQNEIVLEEIAAPHFQAYLSAIYPVEFIVNETNLEGLMKLSGRFLNPIVWKKCKNFLESDEIFCQFEMADLLKWSEACNSNKFKERIETYLLEVFPEMTDWKQRNTAHLSCDYDLKKLKEMINLHIKSLFDAGFSTESKFVGAVLISRIMVVHNETTIAVHYLTYVARMVNKFTETGKIMLFEGENSFVRQGSKPCFESLLNVLVVELLNHKELPLMDILLKMSKKYNFNETKQLISVALERKFHVNQDLQLIDTAVKYDLQPLKTSIQAYLKTNKLTEESKDILLNSDLEVTRFALEAFIKSDDEAVHDPVIQNT